jgi:hypothetical protein
MTGAKAAKPRVGDECWFVEWTYELAWVDGDDRSEDRVLDRDNCKTKTRRVASREDAEKVAREVWPQTHNTFGVVEFWSARFTAYDEDDAALYPCVGFWEATGEGEFYEGDD